MFHGFGRVAYLFPVLLQGVKGSVWNDKISSTEWPGLRKGEWAHIPTDLPDSGDVDHHPFDAEMDHLVDCIREDRESHCNIADGYKTHELCLAIDRSIEQGGRPVTLPLQ